MIEPTTSTKTSPLACLQAYFAPACQRPVSFCVIMALWMLLGIPYYHSYLIPSLDKLIVKTQLQQNAYEMGFIGIEKRKEAGPYTPDVLEEHRLRFDEVYQQLEQPDFIRMAQVARVVVPSESVKKAKALLAETQITDEDKIRETAVQLENYFQSVLGNETPNLAKIYREAESLTPAELEKVAIELENVRQRVEELSRDKTINSAVEACKSTRRAAIFVFRQYFLLIRESKFQTRLQQFEADLDAAAGLVNEVANSQTESEVKDRLNTYAESIRRRHRFLGYFKNGDWVPLRKEMDELLQKSAA